jgi:RNA polymerase sigma-70 factor (ECF subfamily)
VPKTDNPSSDLTNVDENPSIGEEEATELIAKHQQAIWRYLRALGCTDALADDLTQDTFLAILRRPFKRINDSATNAYLRRVAYHLLISYRRRNKSMIVTDELHTLDREWTRWAGFDSGQTAIDTLTDCFSRLSDRAKLSLQMRFRENATRESIANRLKISEHGAKNLMQRAKAQLKECLESRLA